jgi:5-methylcytosine-specific restriction endonuclease McrA
VNAKTGRMAQHYFCAMCENEFTSKDMEVDHIKPVVSPTKGFVSWDSFIENLFCEADNLQAICKSCHKEKSKKETQKRNANRQKD